MTVEFNRPHRMAAAIVLAWGLAACASETSEGSAPPEVTESETPATPAEPRGGASDAAIEDEAPANGGAAGHGDAGGMTPEGPEEFALDDDATASPDRGPASVNEPGTRAPMAPDRTEACDRGGMNDFDWPPPEPSTKVTIPRALLLAGTTAEARTLGEVGERLEAALIEAGYVEFGYQSIGCSGFAMVTRLERIDEDGRPLEGPLRFAPPEARPNWSLGSYIARLFYAPPGYYRQIVFAATEKPYERDELAPAPTREELDEMLERADVSALPEAMLERPFTRTHRLHALIYEFEKGEADRDVRQVSRLAGAAHVRAAGIYSGLGDEE